MQYALTDGIRRLAQPGTRAACPTCSGPVLAKCGSINAWHWAHEAADCDPWSEPESAWHLNWKRQFPEAQTEVVIGPHRADVVTPCHVIELQHSPISPEEIREREEFYHALIWVFDASGFRDNIEFRQKGTYYTFRWKHPRKSLWACQRPMFLDLGQEGLFRVEKLYPKVPCGGWGNPVDQREFLRIAQRPRIQPVAQ